MSTVVINDAPAHRATFYIPRVGTWTIEAEVHSEKRITGKVSVVCEGITYVGTVVRGDLFNDTAHLTIEAGAGGLSKLAKKKHYQATTVRTVADELLVTSGDAFDPTSNALARSMPAWTTITMPIGTVLSLLMERGAGLPWRMLPNGRFWAGAETWPISSVPEYQVISRDDSVGSLELGLLAPSLLPGTTIEGRRISYVETVVSSSQVRAYVLTEAA